MTRILFLSLAVLTLTLLRPGAGEAGTTGKIHGYVRDDKGAPLPGASILLEGARQGAVTDAKGYYVIINVFPGIYTLTASLIGYDRVSKSQVIVIADRTTTVDFSDQTAAVDFALRETALQMSEVTVVAKRPLVEMDKTTSEYVVTVSQIERIGGVRSMQDLLQLLPGFSVDGSNRIRGSFVEQVGYGTDVAYIVDGVRMNHNDARGKGGTFQSVNRGAVQEVSVLAGVMPAEYGNAQAGAVNIVTKEGGRRYDGWVESRFEPAGQKHWGVNVYDSPQHLGRVRWEDPAWTNERHPATGRPVHQRTDYERWSGWQAEANLSGPAGEKASFVASVRHDQLATPLPGPSRTGFYDEQNRFVSSGPDNLTLSGSLTFKPSANLKLKAGGLLQRWSYWNPGNEDVTGGTGSIFNLPGVMRGLGDAGRDLFLPEGWSAAGRQRAREELEYAVLTHALSPKTFYEVRLSRSRSLLDTSGASLVTALNAQDADKWFSLGRPSAARWRLYDRQRYTLRLDLSSQVTEKHFIKAGVEFIRGSLWLTQFVHSDPAERRIVLYADKLQFGKSVHPLFLSAYAQDKMEFEGMIVNLGLRLDALNLNVRTQQHGAYSGAPMFRTFTRARDYLYDDQSIWSIDAPWHVYFGPRVGISHPITSKAQIRFSTGVFYQFADLFYHYGKDFRSFGRKDDIDVNGNGRIDAPEQFNNLETNQGALNGTPLLRPAKSTNFEVGTDWNFVSDYTATLTTYYKSDVEQFTWYPNESWFGARDRNVIYARTLDNGSWSDTRGIELSLKKGFKDNFSFHASYTLQWTRWTTGKLGNVVRNVYMDSLAVANLSKTGYTKTFPDGQQVFVPDFWIDFDPSPTGREIPRKMTEADIRRYGAQAQADLDNARKAYLKDAPLGSTELGLWDGVYPMAGEIGKKGVYTVTGGYSEDNRSPRPGDRRSFGSLALLLSLPDDFRPGPAFLGSLLRGLRATLINRFETGALTLYSSPQGGASRWLELKMDTRTDLSVEKTFRPKARVQPTLFVDIRNLFNQQDRTSPPAVTDYFFYGFEDPRPDDAAYLKYGDINDRNYAHFPRRWNVGIRVNW